MAFIDRGMPNYLKVSKTMDDLASLGYSVYTSLQVVTDVYVLLSRDISTSLALEFLQTMLQSGIEILYPQRADLITAHRILRANRDREIPFSEALNATLMQKRGIMQILTFAHWNNLFGTFVSNLVKV